MDEYQDTRLLDIVVYLQNQGFNVYLPGKHQGECTAAYVVVRTGVTTQFQQFSSTVTYYDVMCYVPGATPSKLDKFVDEVTLSMKGLAPMIRPTYEVSEAYYDDAVKGCMKSITYINYRKV